jgi:hypothetical protein
MEEKKRRVMRRKCKTGELEDGRWKGNMVNG